MRVRFAAVRAANVSLALAMVAALALGGPVSAAESRILSVTQVGPDAQIVDVTVSGISFDAETGEITLTGSLRCDAGFDVLLVELDARQTRGAASRRGSELLLSPPCDAPFTAVIAASEGLFKPGRVTIDVLALACARQCGEETVRVEAVLVP